MPLISPPNQGREDGGLSAVAAVRRERPDCKCSRQDDQAWRPCLREEQNMFPDPPTFGSLPCSARACRPSSLAVTSCPKGSVIPGHSSQGLTSWAWEGCPGGQHKGSLFLALGGGYTSPQGDELSFLSPSLLQREPTSSLEAWPLLRTLAADHPRHPDVSSFWSLCSRPVSAWECGPQEGCALQRGNGSNQIPLCLFSL